MAVDLHSRALNPSKDADWSSSRLLSVIDLRSDTVTKPTEQMRAAMLAAPVGDDVYAEDPTVNELERRVAGLLGHEAGLLWVTGSMCNVLGIRLLVEPGREVICDVQAHIARAEMGAHAAIQGVTMRTFPSVSGKVLLTEVAKIISPSAGPYLVSTAAVAVENTHNFGGGTIQSFFFFLMLMHEEFFWIGPVQRTTSGAGCAAVPCVRMPFLWMCLMVR